MEGIILFIFLFVMTAEHTSALEVVETKDGDTARLVIVSTTTSAPVDLFEREVLGFRLWMILAFVFAAMLLIVVILCCIFDCRIPRTKQEIEADQEKRENKKRMRQGLPHYQRGQPPPHVRVQTVQGMPGAGGPNGRNRAPQLHTAGRTLPPAGHPKAGVLIRSSGTRTMEATARTLSAFPKKQ